MPYATKLLADELQTYMNMGIRIITEKGLARLGQPELILPKGLAEIQAAIARPLPERILPETRVPEFREAAAQEEIQPAEEDLYAMGVIKGSVGAEEEEGEEGEEATVTPSYAEVTPPQVVQERMEEYAQVTPAGTPPVLQGQPQPQIQMQQQMLQMPQMQQMPQQAGGSYMIPTMHMQQMPQMPQQVMHNLIQGGGAYMSPAPLIYQAPVPNAPQTIVIDTSPQAMDQFGYLEDMQMASRGMPVMGSMGLAAGARQMGGGANQSGRRVTPRNRSGARRVSFGSGDQQQNDGPIHSSARVTVRKLG
jgi:hypothetical protein